MKFLHFLIHLVFFQILIVIFITFLKFKFKSIWLKSQKKYSKILH